MSRKEYLENIILGTLLDVDSEQDYYEDCRYCVTADMFSDEVNGRIYNIISDMRGKGKKETSPLQIVREYGEAVYGLLSRMLELVVNYSFLHLKTEYNEKNFLCRCIFGQAKKPTDVQFVDYVNQYLVYVYERR